MVRCEESEEVVTAYICGEIDHHIAKELRDEIDKSIETYRPELLILDFRDVTFMDSSGIGLVMGRYKKVREYGGKTEISNPSPQIAKVMKIAGLDRLAEIKRSAVHK
ncbi:MAG: anti-sigma factor antagonist [Acutalibacteraceae bacterium]